MKERHDKSCLVSARLGTSHHLSLRPVTRLCLTLTLSDILSVAQFLSDTIHNAEQKLCWTLEWKQNNPSQLLQQRQHPSNYLLHFGAATDPGTLCQFNYQVSRSWPLPDNSPEVSRPGRHKTWQENFSFCGFVVLVVATFVMVCKNQIWTFSRCIVVPVR